MWPFHRHKWVINKDYWQGYYVSGGPWSRFQYSCYCKKTKTKTVTGHWTPGDFGLEV